MEKAYIAWAVGALYPIGTSNAYNLETLIEKTKMKVFESYKEMPAECEIKAVIVELVERKCLVVEDGLYKSGKK